MSSASRADADAKAHFDALHRSSEDPWGAAESWYERRKRAVTVACLPEERYGTCFEPGCSIGLVTVELAARCDSVLAMDFSPAAVERARRRTASLGNVNIGLGEIPANWPVVPLDLIVLSEIGYYLDPATLPLLTQRIAASLTVGGTLVAVHGRQIEPDYLTPPEDVHAVLAGSPMLDRFAEYRDRMFALDVLKRAG